MSLENSPSAPLLPSPEFSEITVLSAVTQPWAPLYFAEGVGGEYRIGLFVGAAHCNLGGVMHGGVLATLVDNALGSTCMGGRRKKLALEGSANGHALKDSWGAPPLTLGLQVDYLQSILPGQWLEIQPELLRVGGRIAVAQALVRADGILVARASATFSLPPLVSGSR